MKLGIDSSKDCQKIVEALFKLQFSSKMKAMENFRVNICTDASKIFKNFICSDYGKDFVSFYTSTYFEGTRL